jgi:proline iminopeptidase
LPNVRWLLSLITAVHRWFYVATGGRLGAGSRGHRFLLLTHLGRRSGRHYTVPLLYVEEGGRWIVVASNAGDERHPAWWLNLRERPEAEIQVGPARFAVKAHTADGEERARLWPIVVAAWPDYDRYRQRTQREIPVVLLERCG